MRNVQFLLELFKQVEDFSDRDFSLNLEPVEAVEVFDDLVRPEVLVDELDYPLPVLFRHSELHKLLNEDTLSLELQEDRRSVTIFSQMLFEMFEVELHQN